MVRYSFLVGLFHPLLHAGLSRRTLPHGRGSVRHFYSAPLRAEATEILKRCRAAVRKMAETTEILKLL